MAEEKKCKHEWVKLDRMGTEYLFYCKYCLQPNSLRFINEEPKTKL